VIVLTAWLLPHRRSWPGGPLPPARPARAVPGLAGPAGRVGRGGWGVQRARSLGGL